VTLDGTPPGASAVDHGTTAGPEGVLVVTIAAWTIILMMGASAAFGVLIAILLLVGWVRGRMTWSAPSIPMHEMICPMGELQDPQYLDERRVWDSSVDDAHDTAVAVMGIGIKPFTNRAPLSVPRTERSQRHG
jgi:hypothetical protein